MLAVRRGAEAVADRSHIADRSHFRLYALYATGAGKPGILQPSVRYRK